MAYWIGFLLIEKENKVVKFHAMQSLITFVSLFILMFVVVRLPGGRMFSNLIWLLGVVLWIVLMYKAYSGEKFKLPVIGDIADRQVNK